MINWTLAILAFVFLGLQLFFFSRTQTSKDTASTVIFSILAAVSTAAMLISTIATLLQAIQVGTQ